MDKLALRDFMDEQAQLPMRLGFIDCCTFVTGALKAGWGTDLTFGLEYHDRKSAVAQLRREGHLRSAVIKRLGEPVPASELGVGDLVFIEKPSPTLGLVLECPWGLYVAVKMHQQIIRLTLQPDYEGWKVSSNG